MLICYVFQVFSCAPCERKQIYNLTFRPKEIQMMDYILELVDKVEDKDLKEEEEDTYDFSDDDEYIDEEEQDEEEKELEVDTEDEQESAKEERKQPSFPLPSRPILTLSEALFQLSMMFWTYQDPARDMTSSVLVHFTAVLSIHRHSLAYRSTYNSTSGFASLIWIGQLLFLEYALPLYTYTTLPISWPARNTYLSQRERLEAI